VPVCVLDRAHHGDQEIETEQTERESSTCTSEHCSVQLDIWKCVGGARQKITFAANGELQAAGKCVTGSAAATLQPCKAAASQIWTHLANGEYVLKSGGKCLTDPGNSTVNGRQLTLAACKNQAAQHWSLP
jgi:hypothetical protein